MSGFEFQTQNARNTGFPATAYEAGDAGRYGGDSGTGSGQTRYRVLDYTIDLSVAGVGSATNAEFASRIPSGATIVSAEVKVLSTLSGGSNLNVGLVAPDGTGGDPDALVAAAAGTAVGTYVEGSGAAVGASTSGDRQVTASGRTAGEISVRVTYIP